MCCCLSRMLQTRYKKNMCCCLSRMVQTRYKKNMCCCLSKIEIYSNDFVVIAILQPRITLNTPLNRNTKVKIQILFYKSKENYTVRKIVYIKDSQSKEKNLLLIQKNSLTLSTNLKILEIGHFLKIKLIIRKKLN